jgi:hypothetical protein
VESFRANISVRDSDEGEKAVLHDDGASGSPQRRATNPAKADALQNMIHCEVLLQSIRK